MVEAAELIPVPCSFLTLHCCCCGPFPLLSQLWLTPTHRCAIPGGFSQFALEGCGLPHERRRVFSVWLHLKSQGSFSVLISSRSLDQFPSSVSRQDCSSRCSFKVSVTSLLAFVYRPLWWSFPATLDRPHVFLLHFHHLWNENHCIPPMQPDPLLPRAWRGTTQIISVKLYGHSEDTMNVFGQKYEQPNIYM